MLMAMMTALMLSGPVSTNPAVYEPDDLDACTGQIVCPMDRDLCQCAPRVINLGSWDPRPAPEDWHDNAYSTPPPDFGVYSCEKPEAF